MLGIEPTELMGRPYAEIFAPSARRDATIRFRWLARHPSAVHRMRLPFRHADGHDVLVEINGTGMTADGQFIGAHGAARDVSERDRLERDLRRQAGELAAGEERAHLARELHDSVTQALFSMTLVSRSVEMLLDRDAGAARTQLAQLRDLQREALAEMRALIFELRPGNLEQDGLTRALRTHTAALQGRIGLPVVVESTVERAPAAADRGGPLPDRPGGAPQRGQARQRAPGPGRARPHRERRPAADHRRRQGLRSRARARTATSGWPGCAPGPRRSARGSRSAASPARGRPSRSSSRNAALAGGGRAPRWRPSRRSIRDG